MPGHAVLGGAQDPRRAHHGGRLLGRRVVDGEKELGRFRRRRDEVGAVEQHPGLGQRADRHAVPGRDHLVVAARAGAPFAGGQQDAADPVEPLPFVRLGQALQYRRAMLECPGFRDAERAGREVAVFLAEDLAELCRGPDVVRALAAVAVGVERGGKPALGCAQLPEHEVAGLFRHPAGERGTVASPQLSRPPPQVRVHPGEQRVVVEHLLEVRHGPARVHAVPGEAAAKLVVHAAAGHRLAGRLGHRQGGPLPGPLVVAEQELQDHRRRELRCAAESGARPVEARFQSRHRGGGHLFQVELARLTAKCRHGSGVLGQRLPNPF